jgi:hypothetical protein
MCFSFLDKCRLSKDEDGYCVFAKNIDENITKCKLIYPLWSKNSDVKILPKCFNEMSKREKHSWARKLDKQAK